MQICVGEEKSTKTWLWIAKPENYKLLKPMNFDIIPE